MVKAIPFTPYAKRFGLRVTGSRVMKDKPNPETQEIRSTKCEIRKKSEIQMFECSIHGIGF